MLSPIAFVCLLMALSHTSHLIAQPSGENIEPTLGTFLPGATTSSSCSSVHSSIVGTYCCDPVATTQESMRDRLISFIQHADKDGIEELLAGKQLDEKDKDLALQMAATQGQTEIASLLIQAGVNVNSRDKSGDTPLMLACNPKSNINMITLLIGAGAKINYAHSFHKQTALIKAFNNRQFEIARFLLDYGADPHIRSYNGDTGFRLAHQNGLLDIVLSLIQTSDINDLKSYPYRPYTPLTYAIQHNHIEIVEALLNRNSLDERDKNLALQMAVTKGQKQIVSLLIQAGANVNSRNETNRTLLMLACTDDYSKSDKAIAELLLDAGAEIDATKSYQETALMLACQEMGNRHIARLLIERGANIHAQTDYGWTALMVAIQSGKEELVRLLIDKGANPYTEGTNNSNWQPITVMSLAQNSTPAIRKLINDYIADNPNLEL